MATNDLATVQPSTFAVMQADPTILNDIMTENLGAGGISLFKLKRLKIPAAGVTQWELPDDEGYTAAFNGILLLQQPTRTYYKNPLGQGANDGNQPPDCSSADGLTGFGYRTEMDKQRNDTEHACEDCPLSKWGAMRQKPPCKEQRMLFILRQDDVLPVLLVLPPTGLKALSDYMLGVSYKAKPYYGVITEFGLEKVKGVGTPDYARIKFRQVGSLAPDEMAVMRQIQAPIKKMVESHRPNYAGMGEADITDGAPTDLVDENY